MKRRRLLSKRAATGLVILLGPLAVVLGWDFYQSYTSSGIYRVECKGTVIKTRRTLLGYIDIMEGCSDKLEGRRRRYGKVSRRSGHWVARIRADTGKEYNVAISQWDYHRVRPGQFVVCMGGKQRFYSSRREAVKAVFGKPGE
jgi:hypothetical protein